MTKLDKNDLEFSKAHLSKFDDSDFFPKLTVYQAIWSDWTEFSASIVQSNVDKIDISPAVSMPTAKGLSTYRIVHQLDSVSSIVYLSLTHKIASSVEKSRQPISEKIACSFRFLPKEGSFYSGGSGYDNFKEQSNKLSEKYGFFATTDISDYYNQIYTHRVRAAIEASDPQLEKTAADFESVLHRINAKASKGIPVGPQASGIVAESIMIDIDQLIQRLGVEHTRYVDDFRMASDDPVRLSRAIEELSIYFYNNHRLHLNADKTRLMNKSEFMKSVLRDHEDEEIEAAIHEIQITDPYTNESISIKLPGSPDSEMALKNVSGLIRKKFSEKRSVDLNLLKSFLRRSKVTKSELYIGVANDCLPAFLPVFHELAKTMEVTEDAGRAAKLLSLVETMLQSPFLDRRSVRIWLSWICAGSEVLLSNAGIREYVYASNLRSQARAAKTRGDLAWVRGHRDSLMQHSPIDRAEIIMSTSILGKDERKNFLYQIGGPNSSIVDSAAKKFVLG